MSNPWQARRQAALPRLVLRAVLAVAAGLGVSGCSSSGGDAGPTIVDSAGTGTHTLAVRGTVEARDVLVAGSTFYTSDFSVEVWADAARNSPLSGATVAVADGSGALTSLKENLPSRPGTYVGSVLGYPQAYTMSVAAGALGTLSASIVGPPVHTVTLSQTQPIAVNAATTVTWSPSGETSCGSAPNCVEIDYNGLTVGPAPLPTADDGSFTIPAKGVAVDNFLDTEPGRSDEERIEITRFKRIDIDADATQIGPGGAFAGSGSFIEIGVRARTARLDTRDTRLNSITGTVDDPAAGACADEPGNVIVAAWASTTSIRLDVASALASATLLDASYGGAAAPAAFTLANLEPTSGGGYRLRAWVDSNGNGRLDTGECFGEPAAEVPLDPSPGAAATVALFELGSAL